MKIKFPIIASEFNVYKANAKAISSNQGINEVYERKVAERAKEIFTSDISDGEIIAKPAGSLFDASPADVNKLNEAYRQARDEWSRTDHQ